jgi:hypothetical protein
MLSFKTYLTEKVGAFTAWHGSGVRFNKFEKVKAHSGGGGAAYGSGIYISKNIDVGKYYQKLSKSNTATLYEIKVTIDTDKLLRWDLTLNQQPAFVKKVLETVYYDFDSDPNPKASKVFYALRSSASSGKVGPEDSVRASEYLEEQGIQGVFFSKDKKLPGQNFVIFNPKRISILKRFDNKGKEII